jgi:hypothetical protein
MVELNKEVTGGARQLVEADAQARKEIVGVHRDLQAERARLDTEWGDLENERRQIAGERRTESLLAPAFQTAGLLAVVALLLGFCWYALVKVRHNDELEGAVSDLLLDEVLSDKPQSLLLGREQPHLLPHSPTHQSAT